MIAKQPDLGTALLVFAAGMYVIFFAGLSWKLIAPAVVAAVVAVAGLVVFECPGPWWRTGCTGSLIRRRCG